MRLIKLIALVLCIQSYAQDSVTYDEPLIDLHINKKSTYESKPVNNKAIMFATGTTLTTIGIVSLKNNRGFDHKSVQNSIPIDPYRLLTCLGLVTITISITLP